MKVALVGLGVIGKVHLAVLKELGADIVAVCDILPERCEGAGAAVYTDYEEMLAAERPDAVHICTPHYLHADMVVRALELSINVLCEKPLCIKKEDIARVLEAERKSSAQLGVCLQNRYNASSVFVKDRLSGRRIDFAFGSLLWHRDAAYYASGDWRGKWATEGGGVLINQAIHTVDLLEWICGEPDSVEGRIFNHSLEGVIEVEDTAYAMFGGEVPFEIFATNTAAADMPVEIVVLSEGERITLLPDAVTVDGKPVALDAAGGWYGKRQYGSGHARLIAHFYDSLARGEKFPVDGAEGARSVRAVLAVYASGGARVPV